MKVNLKPRSIMYPSPAVVASAFDEDGNADCCTLAFATMCSHHPPAVMIAINTTLKRKTLKSILYSKEFCIGYPSVNQVLEADYMGIASGYDTNKIEDVNFSFKKAEKVNAPIINEFKVSAECRLMHVAEVGSHTQLTGEVVNIQADEEILNEKNKIDLTKLNPLAYDDGGHDYYKMGEKIADSHKCGLKFKK